MAKKRLLLITLCVLLALGLNAAKHSSKFVLGTYTNMRNTFAFHAANKALLAAHMKSLGYNSTFAETDSAEPDLRALLDVLDENGIDAMLWDRSWSNDPTDLRRYAAGTLSASNYMRFEAEFVDETDVKPGDRFDNTYWYASRNEPGLPRIGRIIADPEASYEHSWLLSKGMPPGYAYTDLKYRWINKWGAYSRVGTTWYLHQTNPPNFPNQFVYLRFRVKIDNIDPELSPDEPLFTLSAEAYFLEGSSYSRNPSKIKHHTDAQHSSPVLQTDFTLSQLKSRGAEAEYIDLELRIPYKELLDSGVMTMDLDNNPSTPPSATVMKLINLNPRLYWYGKCDLYLDFVEFEDQIHYDFRTNPEQYKQGMIARWRQLEAQSPGNIAALYTYDEPFQGQFNSYSMVQSGLEETDVPIMTAVYDAMYRQMVMDADLGLYYDHLQYFRNTTQPKIVAPDIYPISPEVQFNEGNENFIQNLFDTKLHEAYLGSKVYTSLGTGNAFIPIIQSFGRWAKIGSTNQWTRWILPPYATQKVLNYLPLCYGVDGVYQYRFQSYQNSQGIGDHSTMNVIRENNRYSEAAPNPITWQALLDSNFKLKLYGETLRKYRWLGTQTLMSESSELLDPLLNAGISDMAVEANGDDPYIGYIQTGVFEDESKALTLVLVNRRGNFFAPGKYTAEKYVSVEDYDTCFPEASEQKLVVKLDPFAEKLYGKYPALYDPADSLYHTFVSLRAEIAMPAGEAKLLHLVGHLPDGVKGTNSIGFLAEVRGEIELGRRSKTTVEKDGTLILMPGSRLKLDRGAKLIIRGKLVLMPGATIEPRSALIIRKNAIISDYSRDEY